MFRSSLLCACLVILGFRICHGSDLKLIVIPKEDAEKQKGYCLDGSPPAIFFAPAKNESMKNNWALFFHGGSACTDLKSCKKRAGTIQGSSKNLPSTKSRGGPVSEDCGNNPVFCQWNRVILWYCDGMFFAGNREEPVDVDGTKLYFRGVAVLETILLYMKDKLGPDLQFHRNMVGNLCFQEWQMQST
eukprot:m.114998 g.114998  ORF g.114998 m.114998 type:complete len:188 (+) comp14186_c0_seq3:60-623(+)